MKWILLAIFVTVAFAAGIRWYVLKRHQWEREREFGG